MLESVKDYFLIIISLITRIAVTKLNYTVKNDNIESQFLQRCCQTPSASWKKLEEISEFSNDFQKGFLMWPRFYFEP